MKRIILSLAAVATLAQAETYEKHPHERIDEKKQKRAGSEAHVPVAEKSVLERIHFKGDLRLRYESIVRDDKENTYRNRYRLRLGVTYDMTDKLSFEVGMRSGFGNPTSGNQTFLDDQPLGDYFFQSLRFNVLGFTYKDGNSVLKIGREPYMMYRPIKSQLVWDNDVSMNGVNYQYKDDSRIITLGINQPTLEENALDEADRVNLFIAQYVQKLVLESAKLNLGAGFYYYDGLKGNVPLFGKDKGNTLDANGLYANNYHIVEGFAELQFGDLFGMPLKAAAGVVYNFGADDNNFGYDLAIKLGKAKKVGDWQVKYSYTDLQEDATFAAYSDSDNFGGGTGAKGHAIRGKYKAGKNLYLAGSFFFDTLYASKSHTGEEADYERVQLDMIYKF